MSISETLRSYVSENTLLVLGAIFLVPSSIFMIALGISILRIHFAIKRDGKDSPGLGVISLIEFTSVLAWSERCLTKKIEHQAEHGIDLVSIDYTLVQPYIKSMNRFIARAWFLFSALFGFIALLYGWLY